MNEEFLSRIKEALIFARSGANNNRSSSKVDMIHGVISRHIMNVLGEEYIVETKETTGSETKIPGRYINKNVDITIRNIETNKIVAGIGVKMPINTFNKNRINYFENMLGETANIRANNIPYFQIILLPTSIPSWKSNPKRLKDFYTFDEEKLELYKILSKDNALSFYHTPLKTLLFIFDDQVDTSEWDISNNISEESYNQYYIEKLQNSELLEKEMPLVENFDSNVIFNDYEEFINKVCYLILGFD